jgi:hypothetical protein
MVQKGGEFWKTKGGKGEEDKNFSLEVFREE